MKTQHYIKFLFPGSFYSEETIQKVETRVDPVEVPAGAFGYSFFSRTEQVAEGETLLGPVRDVSGVTYFGTEMTYEDVEKLEGDYSILLSNMSCNDYKTVVRTRRGNFQPVGPNDRVIKEQP